MTYRTIKDFMSLYMRRFGRYVVYASSRFICYAVFRH